MEAIATKVEQVWRNVLGAQQLLPGSDFFELGGDSLALMEMLFALGRELDCSIDADLIYQDSSLGGFAALIGEALAKDKLDHGVI